MMYDTSHGNNFGQSTPIRRKQNLNRLPNPPSPRHFAKDVDHEIPWGDRKQASKPSIRENRKPVDKYGYTNHNSGAAFGGFSETDIVNETQDYRTNSSKDGVLFPKNSPRKCKPAGSSRIEKEDDPRSDTKSSEKTSHGSPVNSDENGETDKNDIGDDKMSKRELFWAAVVFVAFVLLTLMITFIVISEQTRSGTTENNISMSQSDKNNNGDDYTPVPTGAALDLSPSTTGGNNGSIGTDQSRKISVREEWELVYSALRDNNITRDLLKGRDATEDALPYDLSFYEDLVSGMVFSEEKRDWIAAPIQDDENIDIEIGFGEMSMVGTGGSDDNQGSRNGNNKKRFSVVRKLTPNQKATAWLLFHDDLKDPNESVWRWAMASIYFKMGGEKWNFYNNQTNTNNWFTNSPLCEWERLNGSSGWDKQKQPNGATTLPVELDFDNTNMIGAIATEFSLLLLPAGSPYTATHNAASTTKTHVRSITLTDNLLNGTIPGAVFHYLMPSLGKLYLDNNHLTGSIPLELGGLDTLYVQKNEFTGDWPRKFCGPGMDTIDDFGLDCDKVECSCCDIHQCYYSGL